MNEKTAQELRRQVILNQQQAEALAARQQAEEAAVVAAVKAAGQPVAGEIVAVEQQLQLAQQQLKVACGRDALVPLLKMLDTEREKVDRLETENRKHRAALAELAAPSTDSTLSPAIEDAAAKRASIATVAAEVEAASGTEMAGEEAAETAERLRRQLLLNLWQKQAIDGATAVAQRESDRSVLTPLMSMLDAERAKVAVLEAKLAGARTATAGEPASATETRSALADRLATQLEAERAAVMGLEASLREATTQLEAAREGASAFAQLHRSPSCGLDRGGGRDGDGEGDHIVLVRALSQAVESEDGTFQDRNSVTEASSSGAAPSHKFTPGSYEEFAIHPHPPDSPHAHPEALPLSMRKVVERVLVLRHERDRAVAMCRALDHRLKVLMKLQRRQRTDVSTGSSGRRGRAPPVELAIDEASAATVPLALLAARVEFEASHAEVEAFQLHAKELEEQQHTQSLKHRDTIAELKASLAEAKIVTANTIASRVALRSELEGLRDQLASESAATLKAAKREHDRMLADRAAAHEEMLRAHTAAEREKAREHEERAN
eukprot:SAG11_NODE_1726_length_4370_cov_3.340904_3_plen_551_part_01